MKPNLIFYEKRQPLNYYMQINLQLLHTPINYAFIWKIAQLLQISFKTCLYNYFLLKCFGFIQATSFLSKWFWSNGPSEMFIWHYPNSYLWLCNVHLKPQVLQKPQRLISPTDKYSMKSLGQLLKSTLTLESMKNFQTLSIFQIWTQVKNASGRIGIFQFDFCIKWASAASVCLCAGYSPTQT